MDKTYYLKVGNFYVSRLWVSIEGGLMLDPSKSKVVLFTDKNIIESMNYLKSNSINPLVFEMTSHILLDHDLEESL